MPDLYLCGDYILPGHQGRGERKKEEMSQRVSQTASESESENELGSKRRSEPMISYLSSQEVSLRINEQVKNLLNELFKDIL